MNIGVNEIPGPVSCVNFNMVGTSFSTVPNLLCMVASAGASHSNARTATSIAENRYGDFNVSPNPASGELRVQLPASVTSQVVRLTDLGGRVVSEKTPPTLETNEITIQLDENKIPDGLYFVEIQTTSGKLTSKVIVQNNN